MSSLSEHELTYHRRLLCAVIYQAVLDWVCLKNSDDPKEIILSQEARKWLLAPTKYKAPLGSFQWMCELLDYDHKTLVKKLEAEEFKLIEEFSLTTFTLEDFDEPIERIEPVCAQHSCSQG